MEGNQLDIKQSLRVFSKYLLEFAHFITRVGELENQYPSLLTLIGPEASSTWVRLGSQLYSLEENDFIAVMRILYKIMKLSFHDIEKLPTSEKIKVGKELETQVKELLKIVGEE